MSEPTSNQTTAGCCSGPAGSAARGEVPLSQLSVGQIALVCESKLDQQDAALLRAMGLAPSAHIKLCRVGEPCIVAVLSVRNAAACDPQPAANGGLSLPQCQTDRPTATQSGFGCCSSRIGLARSLAQRVMVTPLGRCPSV